MMQVREQASNSLHFVGSCGIGRVLDGDLRVIGFDNLKVVDASAIPDMPENSGPAGTTYMLAEYAAEMIISEASHMIGNDDDEKDDGKGHADKKAYKDDKQSERKCS
jgi:choline dehydrogenase-like flavoprotein